MYERKIPIDIDCGVTVFQAVIGAKWKPYIINCIIRGYHRPSEFNKVIKDASKRVLARQLKELEEMGIVRKVVYPTVPLKVEYFLTELGKSMVPIVRMMDDWGLAHKDLISSD